MPSRFVAPQSLESLEQARLAFLRVQEQLDAISAAARPQLFTSSLTLRAGETVRLSPRQGRTLTAKLPKAGAENFGERISIILEKPNGLLVIAAQKPDTVNDDFTAEYSEATRIELQSNGVDQWVSTAQLAGPPGSGGASGLTPISDQRVLGNDSGADAIPSAITVHQELDWLFGDGVSWVFDGINDLIDMGNQPTLTPTATTPFTAIVWVTTTSTANGVLFGKQENAGNLRGWSIIMLAGGQIFLSLRSTNLLKAEAQTAVTVNDGNRHQVAFVHNGSGTLAGFACYIDGVAVALTPIADTLAGNSTSTTIAAQIGARDTGVFFSGMLEHVSWWSDDLTAAEVSQTYAAGLPPDLTGLSFAGDLLDWWKIDATDVVGAGGIHDYGPSALNGTAAGGLAPTTPGTTGVIPVRGAAIWETINPGASLTYLGGNGVTSKPSFIALSTLASTSVAFSGGQFQRAALTGFAAASANSNATTSAEPIVTYSASANMSAERVTTSSTSVAVSTAVANQIEFQRAALSGAISASANVNATLFAGIRDNGSLETARTFINALSTSTITALVTPDAANDEHEFTWAVNQTAAFTWSGAHSWSSTSTFTGAVMGAGVFTSVLAAGANNNVAIGAVNCCRFSAIGSPTLNGMVPTADGQWVFIENVDNTDTLIIAHDAAASTAANRFYIPQVNSGYTEYLVAPQSGVWVRYDGTLQRWILAIQPVIRFSVIKSPTTTPGVTSLEFIDGDGISITHASSSSASSSAVTETINVVFATQALQEAGASLVTAVSPGRQQYHESACKCWGFTSGGATPVLSSSYNVTSITDLTNARITVTIGTDFSSANWCGVFAPGITTATARIIGSVSRAAGAINLEGDDAAGADADPQEFHWAFFGDQA